MYTPRKYQTEAINSIFNYFYKGNKGNPLVVAPTGSGKSIIIAEFCKQVVTRWPGQKILVVSHVKEILVQNYEKIKEQVLNKKIGLFSAGLKSKSLGDITIAGIQSIADKPELFDAYNIIIVDECHTIPPGKKGRYHTFFKSVTKPVIGFTATPYRLGAGYLHIGEDAFFDDIVYTIEIKVLQEAGHLCRVSCKGTKESMSTEGIKKQAGDFALVELSLAFDRGEITKRIITELLIYKQLRKKWLLFTIDIDHCEHVAEELNAAGISAAAVHSRMTAPREIILEQFKKGVYQALVSVAVLTTGFDEPEVDLIGLLRPTSSPVLHVQIIGRGLRPFPGKEDCLVLDFAGNLLRNGPIDNPVVKVKGKGGGEPVMKMCPNCAELVYAAVRDCPVCKFHFIFQHHLQEKPDDNPVLSSINWYEVERVDYEYYVGQKMIPMLKVIYSCGETVFYSFSEYICVEHSGYAKYKADFWWKQRSEVPPPNTAIAAIEESDSLKRPKRIQVDESGKYNSIIAYDF